MKKFLVLSLTVEPTIIQSSQPYLKEAPIQRVSSKNEKGASIPYRPTISCRRSINDPDPDNRIEWALQVGVYTLAKKYFFWFLCIHNIEIRTGGLWS